MIKKSFYLFIIILLISSGCARYKNIAYIQDRYEVEDSTKQYITVSEGGDLILMPNDNVYIDFYGLEYEQLESFKKQYFERASNFNEISLFLKGYFIDETGGVELPVIGKVKIAGLTLSQAKDTLQKKVNEYLKGAVVDIRLLSYNITILGEVKRPGKFQFYKRQINLLDALAKAGDLSRYGDARHIVLIREENGKTATYNFDLTSSDFFSMQTFWLKPNDVIYVKPLKTKIVSVNSPTISLIFTGLTTIILLLTYIRL